jgi:outer membrane protein assembly factor BamB
MVNNDGILQCFDALTGTTHWKQRLKGSYRASPLAAEGRIYLLTTTGLCTVVEAAPRFRRLAENQLDDETIASPIVSDARIFLRGKQSLYCIGKVKTP